MKAVVRLPPTLSREKGALGQDLEVEAQRTRVVTAQHCQLQEAG